MLPRGSSNQSATAFGRLSGVKGEDRYTRMSRPDASIMIPGPIIVYLEGLGNMN